MRIYINGAAGQMGRELSRQLKARGHEVFTTTHEELELTDKKKVSEYIESIHPQAVIHCAAYNAVDKAESEPKEAERINVTATEAVAAACERVGAFMYYFSSDYVFNGEGNTPIETDTPAAPLSVYGRTKLMGEEAVQRLCSKWCVIRISWLFGAYGNNFAKTILRVASKPSAVLRVVNDQVGAPTYVPKLCNTVCEMVERGAHGVYHVSGSSYMSWYEFTCMLLKKAGIDVPVIPVTSEEYGSPAKRPKNSRLSNRRLIDEGYTVVPGAEETLDDFFTELEKE